MDPAVLGSVFPMKGIALSQSVLVRLILRNRTRRTYEKERKIETEKYTDTGAPHPTSSLLQKTYISTCFC